MDYIIWTKDGYAETWSRQDAGDKPAAKRIILGELKEGREPILTIQVPFDLQLNVGEPGAEPKSPMTPMTPKREKLLGKEEHIEADQDPSE